jgi:hypothetical protein
MSKTLNIKLFLDNAQARAANRQAIADFTATTRAAQQSANARQRAAEQLDRLQARYVANDYRRRVKAEADKVKAAAQGAAQQQRIAENLDRVQSRLIAADYRRRVKAEQDKVKAAAQAAAQQQRSADQATKAQQRAADQAAKAAQRAADQAAKAAQRAADQAAKLAQRQAAQQQRAVDQAAKAAQKAADKQAREAQRAADKIARDAQRAADAKLRADQRAAESLDRLQTRYAADDYRRRVRNERQAIESAKRKAEAEKKAAEQTAMAQDRLIGKMAEVAAGYLSIQGAVQAYRAIIDITNQAADAAKRHADETLRIRDSLRELAAIKGKSNPDNEELRRYSDARKASGLTHEEQVTFSTELFNALGTVSEKKLSAAEREKITTQGGQLTARLGGGNEGAKARATVLGLLPNYMQGKNGKPLAGEDVVGTADAGEMILGRGAGSATNAATQFQKTLTSLSSEHLEGKFKNPLKAASLTALATQFGPESAATSVLQAVRETQAITKFRQGEGMLQAQAETLGEAGVTEFMDPEEALTKLFKYIDTETKGGTTEAVPAFLKRRGFINSEGTESLGRFFEQYKSGTFQEIMGLADQPVDNTLAQKKFKEFAASPTGRNRLADAEVSAAEIEQGKKEENLEIARKRGRAARLARGVDQDMVEQARLAAKGKLVGGKEAAERMAEEEEGLAIREKELGVTARGESNRELYLKGLLGPVVGGVANSALNSDTSINQNRANQLETEAKAQAMGLRHNGIGAEPLNAPAKFGERIGNAYGSGGVGGLLGLGMQSLGPFGRGLATTATNTPAVAADPNTALLAKAVNILGQIAAGQPKKQGPLPRPQGKPPGQGVRP